MSGLLSEHTKGNGKIRGVFVFLPVLSEHGSIEVKTSRGEANVVHEIGVGSLPGVCLSHAFDKDIHRRKVLCGNVRYVEHQVQIDDPVGIDVVDDRRDASDNGFPVIYWLRFGRYAPPGELRNAVLFFIGHGSRLIGSQSVKSAFHARKLFF